MNKFLIKNIEKRMDTTRIHGISKLTNIDSPTITLELVATSFDSEDERKLMNHFKYNKPITLESVEYHNWVEPFKKEFKEFLQEKYPERILSDLKGFEMMFGE